MRCEHVFVSNAAFKRCGLCETALPEAAFNRMGHGLQDWCRECFREYFRARGDVHRKQSAAARAKRVVAAKAFVAHHLSRHPCVDCGESDPIVLDFDHLGDKLECVASLSHRGAPREEIAAEIAKCEVRCANCHRRITARRAGWSRLMGTVDDPRWSIAPPVRRNLRLVHRILEAGVCADCGERDMVVLEFDHVGEKRAQLSRMVWNVGMPTLEAEIARCELRCCNCHRRVTAARRLASVADSDVSRVSDEPP